MIGQSFTEHEGLGVLDLGASGILSVRDRYEDDDEVEDFNDDDEDLEEDDEDDDYDDDDDDEDEDEEEEDDIENYDDEEVN